MAHPSHEPMPLRPLRFLPHTLGAFLAIAVLAAVALGIFLFTPRGQAFVLAHGLPLLSGAINQKIEIKKAGGAWPEEIDLTGISVSDAKGVWLEIDRLHLAWHPFAVLGGRIMIDGLHASGSRLLRLPESRQPSLPTNPLDIKKLRRSLDNLRIDDFTVDTLQISPEVFGNPATVALKATLKTEDLFPSLNITLERRDAPGTAALSVKLGDDTHVLNARAAIAGVDLDAAVALSGASEALSGTLHASCGGGFCVKWSTGGIGAIKADADLSGTRVAPLANIKFHVGDLNNAGRGINMLDGAISIVPDIANQTVRLDGTGALGGLKQALPEAGLLLADKGAWALTATLKSRAVALDSFSIKAGDTEAILSGASTGADINSALLSLNLRGAGRLAGLNDSASQTHAELKITKGSFAPHVTATGSIAIGIEKLPAGMLPGAAFNTPIKFSGSIILSPDRVVLSDLSGLWGPATFKGESAFVRAKAGFDHLTTTAALTVAPRAFDSQTKPIQIEAKVEGGYANLSAALTATLDEYQRGAAHLSAIKTNAQAKRSGQGWQGALQADAKINDVPVTLTTTVDQTPTEFAARNIHLAGAGADLTGDLRFSKDRKLVSGAISGPMDDLLPWTLLADFPVKGRGDVKFVLDGETRQRMDVTVDVADFSSVVLGANNLRLTMALDDLFKDTTVKARVRAMDGDISGRRFDQLTASADGDFKKLAVALQAKGTQLERFAVDLEGTVAFDGKTEIAVSRFILDDAGLKASLPEPAHLSITSDTVTLAPMRLTVGTGSVKAQINLARKTQHVDGRISLAGLSLGDPTDILSSGQTIIDGDISFTGPLTHADAGAALSVRFKPRDNGGPSITAKLTALAKDGRAALTGTINGLSAEDARFSADIPVKVDLSGPRLTLDMQAQASANLAWRGEIKPLWGLLGNELHTLAGQADIEIKAAGTLAEPMVTGGVRLTKGLYENLASGTALHNVELTLAAQGGTLVNVKLTATDTAAGTLAAQGVLSKGGNLQEWSVDMAGDLRQFHILRRDDITAAASGHVTYKGPVLAGTLGGNLQITRSEYRLGESYQPEVLLLRGLTASAKPGDKDSRVSLDIVLSARDVLRTDGKGMEAFWRGEIKATGDFNHPDLVGQLTLARGTFSFLGKSFDLERGTVTFTGGGQIDPELNIVGTRQAVDITATVTISGRASQPQITLSSQPTLPQDEVLARLLFRKGTTELGPLESLQIADAAADLTGLSRGGLSGVLRRASGLDIFGFGGQSGNAIVLGRQVSSAVYIGIEQNVNDSSRRVVVEWRLTRNFSLQSSTTSAAGADFGVLWRKSY